jgi:hypothetical protein
VKNRYFGDINDYRKYGLLRALTNYGEIKTAVCWMLTTDDDDKLRSLTPTFNYHRIPGVAFQS